MNSHGNHTGNNLTRRSFLHSGAACVLASSLTGHIGHTQPIDRTGDGMSITIDHVDSDFEREPLIRPFGFKGGYLTEIWQTAARLQSTSGTAATGLCTQSVLWSDASVFAGHSESGGNALMFALTEYALRRAKGITFTTPIDLQESILDDVHEYGVRITGNPSLRKTFTLNALVGFDNAAWLLYARENGMRTFDDMIPARYRPVLSARHDRVACIPLMAYAVPVREIKQAAADGFFFMKIKIGQPGTPDEMLEKDMARLTEIHEAIGGMGTAYSANGKLPYYFDANGRYPDTDTLRRLLDHADRIGALEQIAIVEEPFPEEYEADVSGLGVRIAADESAHTDTDALARIQMGYSAIALKPIAKTLSMTLKIAAVAHERSVPCFCADLTVNPILVDWNKNVAARLDAFPGLDAGLLETNGHQNYRAWDAMTSYHPCAGSSWMTVNDGMFELDRDFWDKSGGIFLPSDHYDAMFEH